jgi:hypothetical protein
MGLGGNRTTFASVREYRLYTVQVSGTRVPCHLRQGRGKGHGEACRGNPHPRRG